MNKYETVEHWLNIKLNAETNSDNRTLKYCTKSSFKCPIEVSRNVNIPLYVKLPHQFRLLDSKPSASSAAQKICPAGLELHSASSPDSVVLTTVPVVSMIAPADAN